MKLATATALLLGGIPRIPGEKNLHKMSMCMYCSFTVLALILLYGGHCFSEWLPSKVMLTGFLQDLRITSGTQ